MPEQFDAPSERPGSAQPSPQIINGTSRIPHLETKFPDTSPEKAESIEELHKRVARRIMDLISANGGLYIKLGKKICP